MNCNFPKIYLIKALQSFDSERSWIIWLSNLLTMNVPELFCSPIFWLWAYLNDLALQSFDYERTWIICLSNLLTMSVPELFGSPIFWLWTYLNYLALQSFDYDRTWIIWLSNLLIGEQKNSGTLIVKRLESQIIQVRS
jgi:hypothetical protein